LKSWNRGAKTALATEGSPPKPLQFGGNDKPGLRKRIGEAVEHVAPRSLPGSPPGACRVEIFDIKGCRISVIPDPDRESRGMAKNLDSRFHGNDKTIVWKPDAAIGSGIYLVRAGRGEQEVTKRIVYLK